MWLVKSVWKSNKQKKQRHRTISVLQLCKSCSLGKDLWEFLFSFFFFFRGGEGEVGERKLYWWIKLSKEQRINNADMAVAGLKKSRRRCYRSKQRGKWNRPSQPNIDSGSPGTERNQLSWKDCYRIYFLTTHVKRTANTGCSNKRGYEKYSPLPDMRLPDDLEDRHLLNWNW